MSETLYAASSTGDLPGAAAAYGAPDGSYADNAEGSWAQTFTMDAPSGALSGTQSVSFYVGKDAAGGNDPTVTITLLDNGATVRDLVTDANVTGNVTLGPYTFTAAEAPNPTFLVTASGAGGKPADRRGVAIDAIVWTAELFVFLGSTFMTWTGSQWVAGKLKRYDGASWQPAQVQRWNGSAWENVP